MDMTRFSTLTHLRNNNDIFHIYSTMCRMLCGVKELFIFRWNGTLFVVNPDVRVSHLTDVSICTVDTFRLSCFCNYF